MRIRKVTAHAFGPLVNQTLELADGLTVVYGPNESAKSTWHAALFAALCGRRRANSNEERDFAQRHRPWDRTDWEVSIEVVLADERRVELRQELVDRVACYAKGLDVVADYSKEITGSDRGEVPDGSRWLGLDRRAFLATACVRQTDLLSVIEQAGGIREHLQRAAATAGADETAAGALKALTDFQNTRVGSALARTRPLQLAEAAALATTEALKQAQRDHEEFKRQALEARELQAAANAAQVRLHGHEAAQAHAEASRLRGEADRLGRRVTEAAELTSLLAAPTAEDPNAAGVAAAVAAWESVPPTPAPGALSPVDTGGRARFQPVITFVGAAVLALVAAFLYTTGSMVPAVAVAAIALVAGAAGLFLSGRASARAGVAARGAAGPADERRQWDHARERAAAQVLAAAQAIGARVDHPAQALPLLIPWLAEEPVRASRREQIVGQRARLAELLDGGSLADLRHQADELAEAAARAADSLPAAPDGDPPADVTRLRREHDDLDRRAFVAQRDLDAYAAGHSSVPEAEERAETAAAELARVQELDRILTLTKQYLTRAQDQVHRTIAPRLAAAVQRDLAVVTSGRYTEAVVDPGTLAVEVRGPGGRLRDADRLSVGTAEQVYLLLRVALAEQLVRRGESCPLLLDDVTVHADRNRTEQILRLLLGVAQRHQVVLFTQQEQVRDWARAELDSDGHAIRELDTVPMV